MERRFELRMEAMLQECEVSPQVFEGVTQRLSEFVEPFAALLTQPAQRRRTAEYLSGLVSDLERKNVESIAYRLDQDRRNLQHFIGAAQWNHRPLFLELARQVGEELGEQDGVIPPKLGKRLFQAAREPKRAHWIPGAGHNNLYDYGVPGLVVGFVRKTLGEGP